MRRVRQRWALVGAVAVMVALVGACASMTTTTDWKGKPIADAIAKFGTPSRITPAPNGQKIYVWMIHHHTEIPRMDLNSNGQPVESNIPHDSVVTWTFYVNESGTIVYFDRSET
ncbi:MAG: hypothetical protein ACHQQS_00260 [Thermoanaerobaculales bacterium]